MGFQADHADFEADHTGYEADQSSGFTPMSQTQQPKRKFNRESANHRQEKVQKKSVKKIVFTDSPPKDTAPNAVTLDPSYQKVACGLTKDQLDMTQLAKSYYL
uniref:Uncharacterized protein n=1 Tax=Arion vulgaris TaxID=1028688 RepID=A0A0B6YBU7_9EUPU